jgi:hypothetical protein
MSDSLIHKPFRCIHAQNACQRLRLLHGDPFKRVGAAILSLFAADSPGEGRSTAKYVTKTPQMDRNYPFTTLF